MAKPKVSPSSPAKTPPQGPAPGDRAPAFDLPLASGGRVSLAKLLGAKRKGGAVILYFYPKDDTTGCTREALDFSAHAGDFEALGAFVIGVSRDSVESHQKFISKHGLSIALASDGDGKASEAYGVWVEKSLYGRTYMGIERATFLIGADGRIVQVWRKVKVPGHVAAVLAAVQALTSLT